MIATSLLKGLQKWLANAHSIVVSTPNASLAMMIAS